MTRRTSLQERGIKRRGSTGTARLFSLLLISIFANLLLWGRAGAQPGMAVVSVREFGAAGNGLTDDTSSLVKAFSETCTSGGGTIYLPPGTYIINPAAASIPICNNLVVHGPGTLKVKPDTGNYQTIFASNPPMTTLHNLTFTGITVDQNVASNTTAAIDVADVRTHQRVWQLLGGTNVHFENMRLYVSGVNSIVVNGPTVSGVYINRNHVVFQKREGQPEFDNSAIYIDGDNFHVTDNTFLSTPSDLARTAIEVHTGSGSVAGNSIDGFRDGMNLVDLKSSSVTGNNIRNAGYGISLWSLTKMDGVTVSGNTVAIAQVTRNIPSSWGIATSYNRGINGDFSNLQISGNIVRFEQEHSARTVSGWVTYGIGLQTLGHIANASILGNEVLQAPVRGIAVGVLDAKYTVSRVSVRNNRIIDAGSNFSPGAAPYSASISLQGNLSSIDVLMNRLDFLSDPFIGRFSYWSFEAGYRFKDIVVADNYATAVAGSPENGLTTSVVQTYPGQAGRISDSSGTTAVVDERSRRVP